MKIDNIDILYEEVLIGGRKTNWVRIRKPPFVVAICVSKTNKILMTRQYWRGPQEHSLSFLTRGFKEEGFSNDDVRTALRGKYGLSCGALSLLGRQCLDATQEVSWAYYYLAQDCEIAEATNFAFLECGVEELLDKLRCGEFKVAVFTAALSLYLASR